MFKVLIRLFCVNLWLVFTVAAQTPEILKVDPPSWWLRSSVNPVRLMIRGRNLHDARLQVTKGLRVVGPPKINDRGTYLFVDVQLASAGQQFLTITTPKGAVQNCCPADASCDR